MTGIGEISALVRDAWNKVADPVAVMAFGKRWWVSGPEGAGKTTLHGRLVGLRSPGMHSPTMGKSKTSSGTVVIDGALSERTRRVKQHFDQGGHINWWHIWRETLTRKVGRMVFIYDLVDVTDVPSPDRALDEIVNDTSVDRNWRVTELAFDIACTAIEERYAARRFSRPRAKCLLIFANKADVWAASQRDDSIGGGVLDEPPIHKAALQRLQSRAGLMNLRCGVQPVWAWGSITNQQTWFPDFEDVLNRIELLSGSKWPLRLKSLIR